MAVGRAKDAAFRQRSHWADRCRLAPRRRPIHVSIHGSMHTPLSTPLHMSMQVSERISASLCTSPYTHSHTYSCTRSCTCLCPSLYDYSWKFVKTFTHASPNTTNRISICTLIDRDSKRDKNKKKTEELGDDQQGAHAPQIQKQHSPVFMLR